MNENDLPGPPPTDDDIWLGYYSDLESELAEQDARQAVDSWQRSQASLITWVGRVIQGPLCTKRGWQETLKVYPPTSFATERQEEKCCEDLNCAGRKR